MNFFSDLSLWWIPLFLVFAVGISYFYYFRTSQKTSWEKKEMRILFGLRAAGLFLLLLMLLGLVWESISYRKEKPLFVTMIDQSASMMNYRDSARVKGEIENFRKALAERYGDKFELRTLSIGEKVTPDDTLRFNQKKSNLAAGFDHLHDQFFNRNLGGVVLISDGNFNDGAHPMYSAERLQFTPVFTLGVGDTINKKDLALRSVLSNEVAFTNNVFPIEAIVDANKYAGSKVEVSLLHNGKTIQRKSVQIANSAFDQQRILFEVEAKDKGFQRYTVVVEHKKGEFTFDNNAQTCYIEIVDTKSDIVILADAPHPDLAAIRSVLSLDKRTTIQTDFTSTYTVKNKLPDLVIWYENGTKPNYGLFQQLKDKGVPVWFILGPTISIASLNQFGLNIKIPNTSQQDDVYPTISSGFNAFQFTDECQEMLRLAPPLRAKFGSVGIPNDAEVLLTQRIGNISKKDPLLLVLNSRKAKIGVILGEGIWRWKMKEFMLKKSNAGFEEFVNKVATYLTIKQNTDPFRVTFPKRFNVAEEIEAKAEYYSEAMELITTPEISLTVTKTGGKPVKISFTPVSNFYKAGLGQLSAGTYRWTATAKYKGKTIAKSGTFVVDDIALEQLTNRADFNVLQQVSKQSDGSFHELKDYNKLLNQLEKRSDIATVQFEDSGFTSIIDWWWYFVIMIIVFGTEWFLRRRWGSY